MDHQNRKAYLTEIERLWIAAGASRPPSVWIAEHEAMEDGDITRPTTPVAGAWFLNDQGMVEKSASEYVRFITVLSGVHWYSGFGSHPVEEVYSSRTDRMRQIGMATFAPILNSELVYLDVVLAGLFGVGRKYRYNQQTKRAECVQGLWTS